VSSLPLMPKLVLAVLLVGSMGRAFVGTPAQGRHDHAARTLFMLTGVCYLAGAALVVAAGAGLVGTLVVIAGIETACLAAWLVRGAQDGGGGEGDGGDDGDGGDGPGGGDDGDPSPFDWGAFDRERAGWSPRVTA